jgi:hypothetical protein
MEGASGLACPAFTIIRSPISAHHRASRNLSSAIRLYVLDHYRRPAESAPDGKTLGPKGRNVVLDKSYGAPSC